MKRFTMLCGIIAALLCLTQNANAQYTRKGADIVDDNGAVLTDSQLIDVVGLDVFEQTVIGARKQIKSGNSLLWGGIAGFTVGFVGGIYAAYRMAGYKNDVIATPLYLGSSALMSAGGSAITAGIVLKSIGNSRLNWVEEQANAANGYSLNVGATPNGIGLYIAF